jgi:zinc protease
LPIRTQEPPQQGERRVSIEADAQTPLVQFAYHALAGSDPRQPALELMTRILTDGDASRLHRVLVEEKKLAISADSYVDRGFDPGLAWFLLMLPAGADTKPAEAAFDLEIQRLRDGGVTAQELARARSQALADFWRGMATIDGKAQALGQYAVLQGGYQRLFDAPRAYESVTAEDIRKLAADLLQPGNRTVGVLTGAAVPTGQGEGR